MNLILLPQVLFEAIGQQAIYTGEFTKKTDEDGDFLHWGEGIVSVSGAIAFEGELAPETDCGFTYHLDSSETNWAFNDSKENELLRVGDVKHSTDLWLTSQKGTDLNRFNTVVIWCENFWPIYYFCQDKMIALLGRVDLSNEI